MVLAVTLPTWLDADTMLTVAIALIGALLALALVSAWLVKQVVGKVIALVILLGLALAVWTQRANLRDCASQVADRPTAGATCRFFGMEVQIPAADVTAPSGLRVR